MICPRCHTACGHDCDLWRADRAVRLLSFKEQRIAAKDRIARMENGDLTAFHEELELLKNSPLRQCPRVLGDEFLRRVDQVIALADRCGQRDISRQFRTLS